MNSSPSRKELLEQIETLTRQLQESEEALRAIRSGEVDAIIVSGAAGDQVFSLAGTDMVYRQIVETMNEAALTVSLEGTITFCNRQFGAFLQMPTEQIIGRELSELIAPQDRGAAEELLEQGRLGSGRRRIVFQGVARNLPAQAAVTPLATQDDHALCVVVTDLTEMERRAQRLRALALDLTMVEQEERRRIAGILHDHLQQLLVAARYQIDLVARRGDKELHGIAAKVDELLSQSITLSRSLTAELSTPALHNEGLVPALSWLAIWMHSNHGLTVNLSGIPAIAGLGEEVRTLLFQSVRELLLNVAKHAHVDSAGVAVLQEKDGLRIVVSDTGKGFDPSAPLARDGRQSFGLFSIQERLGLIGGSMEIESMPGNGCLVTLRVPFESLGPDARGLESRQRERSISVLVVDEHDTARNGIVDYLETAPGIRVAGQCAGEQDAVRLAADLHPDVVILDVSGTGLAGAVTTRLVREKSIESKVIGVSLYDNAGTERAMRDAGASAHLRKDGPPEGLLQTIRAVCGAPVRNRG